MFCGQILTKRDNGSHIETRMWLPIWVGLIVTIKYVGRQYLIIGGLQKRDINGDVFMSDLGKLIRGNRFLSTV